LVGEAPNPFDKYKKPMIVILGLFFVAAVISVIALTRNLAVNHPSVSASDEPTNQTDYVVNLIFTFNNTARVLRFMSFVRRKMFHMSIVFN
jgi:hypothetical protein